MPYRHPIPTDLPGEYFECGPKVAPHYIANCGIDIAGHSLHKLMPGYPLKERQYDWPQRGELIQFDQHEFTDVDLNGLDKWGYVFVPNSCKSK